MYCVFCGSNSTTFLCVNNVSSNESFKEPLTWHEETVMQDRHKVRVCVSVVHLLADEIKNLGGTFGVYMYLEEKT